MPPEIGPQTGGDYKEEGGGGFFSKKVGPLPMWAILAAGVIVLYVLYTKYFSNTNSSSNPAVTSNPSTDTTSGTFPWDNLTSALSQIQGNEQGIAAQLTQPANPSTTNLPVNPMPVQTSAGSYAGWGGGPPTAPPPTNPPIPGGGGSGTGQGPNGGMAMTPTSSRVPIPVPATYIPPTVSTIATKGGGIPVGGTSPGVQIGRPLRTGPLSF